jgi:hypothetical protein
MKKILYFFSVLLIFLLSNSCKDDELSKMDLLCNKYWIKNSITISPPLPWEEGNGEITYISDGFLLLSTCEEDDVLMFKTDGTLIGDDNKNRCDLSEPKSQTGTWAFNSDETIINITGPDNEKVVYPISELTDKSLIITVQIIDGSVTYTMTLKFSPTQI